MNDPVEQLGEKITEYNRENHLEEPDHLTPFCHYFLN